MHRQYYIYIITGTNNRVLYTGVTNDLQRRIYEHRERLHDGFAKRYGLCKLVYYEIADDPQAAIAREKQIKAGSRQDKLDLINKFNPAWNDLWEEI